MAEVVACADDLSVAELKELTELRVELDGRGSADYRQAAEQQDRFAEVADLVDVHSGCRREDLAAVLAPRSPHPFMAGVGHGLALERGLEGRVPLNLGVNLG